jgi:hypothetical protein
VLEGVTVTDKSVVYCVRNETRVCVVLAYELIDMAAPRDTGVDTVATARGTNTCAFLTSAVNGGE